MEIHTHDCEVGCVSVTWVFHTRIFISIFQKPPSNRERVNKTKADTNNQNKKTKQKDVGERGKGQNRVGIIPMRSHICWNGPLPSGLVSRSAIIPWLAQWMSDTTPFLTSSRMKLYWISICFVRAWKMAFDVSWIALRLSQWSGVGWLGVKLNAVSSWRSQVASWQASVVNRYSALVDNNAIVGCNLDCPLIAPPRSLKT